MTPFVWEPDPAISGEDVYREVLAGECEAPGDEVGPAGLRNHRPPSQYEGCDGIDLILSRRAGIPFVTRLHAPSRSTS